MSRAASRIAQEITQQNALYTAIDAELAARDEIIVRLQEARILLADPDIQAHFSPAQGLGRAIFLLDPFAAPATTFLPSACIERLKQASELLKQAAALLRQLEFSPDLPEADESALGEIECQLDAINLYLELPSEQLEIS